MVRQSLYLPKSAPTSGPVLGPAQPGRTRVVLVQAKKNVVSSKKKGITASAAENTITPPEAVPAPAQEVGELVVVEKRRTAYRQPKKTPEQRIAERQQQEAELHEARQLPLSTVRQNVSRQAGKRVTMVDAYNVIGAWPNLAALPTLVEKRQHLERYLASYARVNGCIVDLVYDSMKAWGQPLEPRTQPSELSKRVIVTFSGKKSADQVLKEHAAYWAGGGGAIETITVSNDKQVQQDCTQPHLEMMALGTAWLWEKCQEAEQQRRKEVRRTADRKMRQQQPAGPQKLGVGSWAEALALPEEKLRAAGLNSEKVLQLMVKETSRVL